LSIWHIFDHLICSLGYLT